MDNKGIHEQISELVSQEQELRSQAGAEGAAERAHELKQLEVQLDQCWDLLRQRRALQETGSNPDQAHLRPESEVEGYRQ